MWDVTPKNQQKWWFICCVCIVDWNSALMIIINGENDDHLEMLEGGVMRQLLDEKWKAFARVCMKSILPIGPRCQDQFKIPWTPQKTLLPGLIQNHPLAPLSLLGLVWNHPPPQEVLFTRISIKFIPQGYIKLIFRFSSPPAPLKVPHPIVFYFLKKVIREKNLPRFQRIQKN
jgi:hypothetical protein